MFNNIPDELSNLIFEMSGNWKRRFSSDVLPEISRGYRLVGMFCPSHGDDVCDCANKVPCSNCYCYGYGLCAHDYYESVSFDSVKSECEMTLGEERYIPMDVFMHFYVSDVDFEAEDQGQWYSTCPSIVNADKHRNFRKELLQTFSNKA